MGLKYFSLLFSLYSVLSIAGLYVGNEAVNISGLAVATASAFFLRKEYKGLRSRPEFRVPYAGAYLMLLGYLGIIAGIPTSFVSQIHLLGLSLVLVGAIFVDLGVLTALVLGTFRLSKLFGEGTLKLAAVLYLLGLAVGLKVGVVGYFLYLLSSLLVFRAAVKGH